jgi:hypothetical protein
VEYFVVGVNDVRPMFVAKNVILVEPDEGKFVLKALLRNIKSDEILDDRLPKEVLIDKINPRLDLVPCPHLHWTDESDFQVVCSDAVLDPALAENSDRPIFDPRRVRLANPVAGELDKWILFWEASLGESMENVQDSDPTCAPRVKLYRRLLSFPWPAKLRTHVSDCQADCSDDVKPNLVSCVWSSFPKLQPVIEIVVAPVEGKLNLFEVPLITKTVEPSAVKLKDAVPNWAPIVMAVLLLLAIHRGVKHINVESEIHNDRSQEVSPTIASMVKMTKPKFFPWIWIDAEPMVFLFSITQTLRAATSVEYAAVKLPLSRPTVIKIRLVPFLLLPAKILTDESDSQYVISQEVPSNDTATVLVAWPKPEPIKGNRIKISRVGLFAWVST